MLKNYYRMFKKRGVKLPILYFLNVHLFDILHKTDTQIWLPKHSYNKNLRNLKFGVLYMAAWTDAINWSFNFCKKKLNKSFKDFKFVDIGCGKGKVLISWGINCKKNKISMNISGFDYYEPLIEIAKKNLKISGLQNNIKVEMKDVVNFKFKNVKTIFFLYNPFNLNLLRKIIKKLQNRNYLIIYNNPVHLNFFKRNDFIEIGKLKKFHKSQNISVLIYNLSK